MEECVSLIMNKTIEYTGNYSDDELKLAVNFPSVFLHYCRLLKTGLSDRRITYGNLAFLKSKYLDFGIQNKKIQYIRFVHHDSYTDELRMKLNEAIKLYLDGVEWDDEFARKVDTAYAYSPSTPTKKVEPASIGLSLDLTILDKFKF